MKMVMLQPTMAWLRLRNWEQRRSILDKAYELIYKKHDNNTIMSKVE